MGEHYDVYTGGLSLLLPIALIAALMLTLRRPTRSGLSNRYALMLITCAAAWCSLVQFPVQRADLL